MSFVRFLQRESRYLYYVRIDPVVEWIRSLFSKAGDDKRPRDPRPRLMNLPGSRNQYVITPIHMALVNKNREMITSLTSCRDYMNEAIRYFMTGGQTISNHTMAHLDFEIDQDCLRLAIVCDQDLMANIDTWDGICNGVRVANMYGRVAGWGKLWAVKCKRAVDVNERNKTVYRDTYMIVGDRRWQRTPQYISLLLLLIRLCVRYEVPSWITDAYALEGYWHELLTTAKYDSMGNHSDLTSFFSYSYEHLIEIMANDEELFPQSVEGNYAVSRPNFHYGSGLYSLTNPKGVSTHVETAKKLKQLMEVKDVGKENYNWYRS